MSAEIKEGIYLQFKKMYFKKNIVHLEWFALNKMCFHVSFMEF